MHLGKSVVLVALQRNEIMCLRHFDIPRPCWSPNLPESTGSGKAHGGSGHRGDARRPARKQSERQIAVQDLAAGADPIPVPCRAKR